MRIFLDTEWADNAGRKLVSMGLVSEDNQHRFYSEVSPLPKDPTNFVRSVVYPLLEHGYSARQTADFTRDLRAFLARFDTPFVLFDHPVDGTLFRYALDGFDLSVEALGKLSPAPEVAATHIASDEVRQGIELYFDKHPDLAPRRHHAGVDAEALRWAFLAAASCASWR